MKLEITQLSITLIPVEKIILPRYPGSTLRGAFGHALKELSCNKKNNDCNKCTLNQMCAYAYLFNPYLTEEEKNRTSNRFNNKPRPFVFHPQTNEKKIFQPGQKIKFTFSLFGSANQYIPYIIESWKLLEEKGLGNNRGKFLVGEIWNKNDLNGKAERIYSEYASIVHNSDISIKENQIKELEKQLPNNKMRLTFTTPILLKYQGCEVKNVEFHILMRNIFRRLSALSVFYGKERLDIDFSSYLNQAEKIKLKNNYTSWQVWKRYSGKQNREIKMKGLVGGLKYEGDLKKFLPYIISGQYIHIGKNTVFGLRGYKIIKNKHYS